MPASANRVIANRVVTACALTVAAVLILFGAHAWWRVLIGVLVALCALFDALLAAGFWLVRRSNDDQTE